MVEAQRQLLESEFKTIESNIEFFVEDVEKPAALVPEEIKTTLLMLFMQFTMVFCV